MMRALEARAAALAEGRVAARMQQVAAAAAALHGVRVETGQDGVVLSGRRLGVRMLAEPALRTIGSGA